MSRGPGQRAGLTRAAVLDAAHAVVAAEGLAGLSMRSLARRLGVAPNALYSHVPGKTELVDALLDDLLAGIEPPAAAVPDAAVPDAAVPDAAAAVEALRSLMTATYEILLTRPDLVPLYLDRQGSRGPNAVRLGMVMDALLARVGVPAEAVPVARRALIVHAIGGAAFTGAGGPLPVDLARADFARSLQWLLTGIAQG